jgi:hypothetical protein
MQSGPSLPSRDALTRLLRDLLGKAVTSKPGGAPLAASKVYVASYVDDAGGVAALGLCDLNVAAAMGTALALMPPPIALEAVRKGRLPPDIFDNLREVMNVMASVFGEVHVKLENVLVPGSQLPAPVTALVTRPRARLDSEIVVTGYPGGWLSLVVR